MSTTTSKLQWIVDNHTMNHYDQNHTRDDRMTILEPISYNNNTNTYDNENTSKTPWFDHDATVLYGNQTTIPRILTL